MNLAKHLALVTGSSSGIGRAIALRLARDGFRVGVHYNSNEKGARETLDEILATGGQGDLLRFDSRDKDGIESALATYFSAHPDLRLDVLVNNAGIHKDTLLGLMSDEAFDSVMKTNVYGPFFLMRFCIRKMLRQRGGGIVNISSLAGQTGNAGQVNYAASKAAVIAMTKSLALEVGGRGVRVNAVAPGLIETEMIEQIPMLEEMKKRIPLNRLGRPEDVAGAVSFLCSPDAAYVTGATISVNGGLFPA
ncbi:MAG: 3-oxoacyl-ACP reductase FabG [Calothrix sp. SM1_5_4]|nr:3-oxoacyl-ACP reductase FabG [Calothrix sp. SM1_5_4]